MYKAIMSMGVYASKANQDMFAEKRQPDAESMLKETEDEGKDKGNNHESGESYS